MIIEAYAIDSGFDLFMLRLGNVFGVGHFWGGSGGGQKVQDLVMAGITGKPAKISEEQTMDFVYLYAKDCGRAIDVCATIDAPSENVFNIAYRRTRKIAAYPATPASSVRLRRIQEPSFFHQNAE